MPLASIKTAVALAIAAALTIATAASAAWHEGFETPESSWRLFNGHGKYRILKHQRVAVNARSGKGCEWINLKADGGARVYLTHAVGRPPIIEELAPSVWVKSDRPGAQISAHIALPRTIDKQTGRPMIAVVTGDVYKTTGRWQQLRLADIPQLLTRQVHILRMQLGPDVDAHEAYLDAVVLTVYCGSGEMNVWIDDLEVAGHVSAPGPAAAASSAPSASAPPDDLVRLPPVQQQSSADQRHTVKLVGGVLLVDDHPFLPRVVQHCGEPLAVLKRIGFNTVWLKHLPTPELSEEAKRLGLWLICPPPRPVGDAPLSEITSALDGVLAWDLGDGLGEAELDAARAWARQVRAADRRGNRPIICRPTAELRGYSRAADLLLLDRRPLGTSIEMAEYADWVSRQPLLASPGTSVWTTVQTQPNESLVAQLSALEPGASPPRSVSPAQIRLLTHTAIAAGSRGLLFLSDSPLDSPDADTRRRAMTLELLNLELQLLEPWAAAGKTAAEAEANITEVGGTVIGVERAQMLLPIWASPGAQCAPAASSSETLSLIVPGVPEATSAYLLYPGGLRPLRRTRVAGGVCVALGEFDLTAQVLLAHDPSIVAAVQRRAAQSGKRRAQLFRELAVQEFGRARATVGQLAARATHCSAQLSEARRYLIECDSRLAGGDASGAMFGARRAMRSLRDAEHSCWDAARRGLASATTSPPALGFDTLPAHWRMLDRLKRSRFGANQLVAGDFEDVGQMLAAGWQNIFQADQNVQTSVDLAPQSAHGGRLGLRMKAAAADQKNPPAAIERPPILLTTPAVQVQAGSIVCIHGWVRIAEPITVGSDGLLIVDSLGGEALAERIGRTDDWQRFALYRAVPRSGPLTVTFALSGLGEAWLDDLSVQVVGPSTVADRRPQ